jgi:uncharacterized BrkB/YihY/UPF0761 family membrane protein
MRLEKQELEQREERKGLTVKTIIQFLWLLISVGIAYVLLNSLVEAGTFSYSQIYEMLTISRTVPEWAIQGVLIIILVIAMQFVFFLAYAWASPEGRRRPGDPSLYSRHKDPFDDEY